MPDMQFPHCKEGRKTQKRPTIQVHEFVDAASAAGVILQRRHLGDVPAQRDNSQISETTGLSASTVTRWLPPFRSAGNSLGSKEAV